MKSIIDLLLEMSKEELIEIYELSQDMNNSHNEKLLELYNNDVERIYGEKIPFLTTVQLNEIHKLAEKEAVIRYIGNGRY